MKENGDMNAIGRVNASQDGVVYDGCGLAPALTTNKGEGNKVTIPVLTPDRAEKRQNGRRFKDDGEPMFTLTGQDRHGVGVEVIGGITPFNSEQFNGGAITEGVSKTLRANKFDASVVFAIRVGGKG